MIKVLGNRKERKVLEEKATDDDKKERNVKC